MGRQVLTALYVVVMIALIVGLDVMFLRNHFWARLATNVGIVAVFLGLYYAFLRH